MGNQPLRWFVAETLDDPPVEASVDGDILGECIGHRGFLLYLLRSYLGLILRGVVKQVKRRRYDATNRQARSAHTRRRILDAARELILEGGYRATTLAAI